MAHDFNNLLTAILGTARSLERHLGPNADDRTKRLIAATVAAVDRGAAVSVAVAALSIACFALTYTFPLLNSLLGASGTFWLYAALCAGGFIFVATMVPETKGKTLEHIEKELAG